MNQVKTLNAVSLTVRDLDASLRWYREKMGFKAQFDDAPNSPGVVIGDGNVELVLRPLEDVAAAMPVDTKRQVCIAMLAFEVTPSELDKVEQEFAGDGEIVKLDNHPKYRSRILEDPDGHAIEFYAEKAV